MTLGGHLKTYFRELCLVLLIFAEVIFKLDQTLGFMTYLLFFILGLIFLLKKYDIAVFLFIPLIRLAGVGIPLEVSLKALLLAFLLGVMMLLHAAYYRISIGHEHFLILLRSRKRMLGASSIGMLLLSIVLGLLAWKIGINPPSTSAFLSIAVLAAIVDELYVRGMVLSQDTRIRFILLTSLWYSILVFSGNPWMALIALVFSLYAGFFLSKTRIIYVPILCHIVVNLIPVIL